MPAPKGNKYWMKRKDLADETKSVNFNIRCTPTSRHKWNIKGQRSTFESVSEWATDRLNKD